MKKIIITVAAILLAAFSLSAKPTGLNIGGGLEYSGWTNASDMPDYFGPYVEVGYDLRVAKNSYVYFGGRFFEGMHVYSEGLTHIGDLFIPIRFQQNFNLKQGSTFYVEAGPAAGFLLYNFATAVSSTPGGATGHVQDLTWSGEPRANIYLGGNIGFNIKKHCKIYAGGDYGFINFNQLSGTSVNRWQLNLGACYVF